MGQPHELISNDFEGFFVDQKFARKVDKRLEDFAAFHLSLFEVVARALAGNF